MQLNKQNLHFSLYNLATTGTYRDRDRDTDKDKDRNEGCEYFSMNRRN